MFNISAILTVCKLFKHPISQTKSYPGETSSHNFSHLSNGQSTLFLIKIFIPSVHDNIQCNGLQQELCIKILLCLRANVICCSYSWTLDVFQKPSHSTCHCRYMCLSVCVLLQLNLFCVPFVLHELAPSFHEFHKEPPIIYKWMAVSDAACINSYGSNS